MPSAIEGTETCLNIWHMAVTVPFACLTRKIDPGWIMNGLWQQSLRNA
jgi:hypothetical protein